MHWIERRGRDLERAEALYAWLGERKSGVGVVVGVVVVDVVVV